MLVLYPAGTGAQTNMLPWLSGTFQPMPRRPPHNASRRRWYSPHWRCTPSSGPVSAAIATFWIGRNMPKSIWVRSFFAGGDDIAAADQKADARARDVEALAQREELDRAFLRARRVEDAAAVRAVEDDVAVGVVMHQQNIVLAAESHDLGVQLRRADAADGVRGQADEHELCLAGDILRDGGNVGQEVIFLRQLVVPRLGTAEPGAGHEDGVARVGQQHKVAVVAQRQPQVPDAVLTAGKAHDLVRRDAVDGKPPLVIIAYGMQHLRQVTQTVFPVVVVLGGVDQRLLQVVGGGKIRCADA